MAQDRSTRDSGRKRAAVGSAGTRKQAKTSRKPTPVPENDEEISGISGSDSEGDGGESETDNIDENSGLSSDEEFAGESAADKRRRLAKQYLDNLKEDDFGDDFNAQDLDDDHVSRRLQVDVAEGKGQIYKFYGDKVEAQILETEPKTVRIGSRAVTAVSARYPYLYTVSKDMELSKWSIEQRPRRIKHSRGGAKFAEIKREQFRNHHCGPISCVAASPDGKYVVTGGTDGRLIVWLAENLVCLKVLEVRSSVNAVAFRRDSDQLYAACGDVRIRTYSINQQARLEVLYGHQDTIADILALARETCVSVGARDKTAMLWKIADELRLTFRGGDSGDKRHKDAGVVYAEGLIDVVSMNDETHFVTGSDNGNVSLWTLAKKKPLATVRTAHGIEPALPAARHTGEADGALWEPPQPQPYWITAVHAVPYSDIFVTGSYDGLLRVWRIDRANMRAFHLVGTVAARGVVVGLDSVEHGGKLTVYAAVSKEHKYGRWIRAAGRNSLVAIAFDIA